MSAPPAGKLDRLTQVAANCVPGARDAVIVRASTGGPVMIAATRAAVSSLQQAGSDGAPAPWLVGDGTDPLRVNDFASDERWPALRVSTARSSGVRSILSFPLVGSAPGEAATLVLCSSRAYAFDDPDSLRVGFVVAAYGSLGPAETLARQEVADLEYALETSRELGIAVGIVMARRRVTRAQAFELLRRASQRVRRALAELAAEVIATGEPPLT